MKTGGGEGRRLETVLDRRNSWRGNGETAQAKRNPGMGEECGGRWKDRLEMGEGISGQRRV